MSNKRKATGNYRGLYAAGLRVQWCQKCLRWVYFTYLGTVLVSGRSLYQCDNIDCNAKKSFSIGRGSGSYIEYEDDDIEYTPVSRLF